MRSSTPETSLEHTSSCFRVPVFCSSPHGQLLEEPYRPQTKILVQKPGPESPRTQHLRFMVPKNHTFLVLGPESSNIGYILGRCLGYVGPLR